MIRYFAHNFIYFTKNKQREEKISQFIFEQKISFNLPPLSGNYCIIFEDVSLCNFDSNYFIGKNFTLFKIIIENLFSKTFFEKNQTKKSEKRKKSHTPKKSTTIRSQRNRFLFKKMNLFLT